MEFYIAMFICFMLLSGFILAAAYFNRLILDAVSIEKLNEKSIDQIN